MPGSEPHQDGGTLEAQIIFKILGDFTDEALKRQLADQKFGRALVLADFSESHRARSKTVRFFHATTRGGCFAGRFDGQLLSGRFAAGRFAGSLSRKYPGPRHINSMPAWRARRHGCREPPAA